jgi:hypothetical protein
VPSAQGAYEIWAILTLDFVMAIFWLASLGANAAQRATFTVPVNIESCYNDGSAISSNHCTVSGARLAKRAVADQGGLAMMSAIAGLSALVWYVPSSQSPLSHPPLLTTPLTRLLFVATLVFHGHTFRLWHQEHKKPSADNATVEMKAQGTPMLAGQPEAQQAIHPQYTDQQQYQSQVYPQQPPQPQQGAYPQQTAAAAVYPAQHQQQQELPGAQPQQQQQQPYAAYPDPAQYQQQPAQQQQPYSPHGTPAPGQAYYPPQQQQQPAYSPHGTPAPGQAYYPPQQPHEKQ